MEETLKLILGKLTDIDTKFNSLDAKINNLEKGQKDITKRLDKIDITLEHEIQPKISALFDAREVSIQSDETIIEGVNEVKRDISHLEKAVIRNTADIVKLRDYRKKN